MFKTSSLKKLFFGALIATAFILPWQGCGTGFQIPTQDASKALQSLIPTSPGGNGDIYSGFRSLKSISVLPFTDQDRSWLPTEDDLYYRLTKAPACRSSNSSPMVHSGLIQFLNNEWHLQKNSCSPQDMVISDVIQSPYNPAVLTWQGKIFGMQEQHDGLLTNAYPWHWCRKKPGSNSAELDIIIGEKIVDNLPAGDGYLSLNFPTDQGLHSRVNFARNESGSVATFVNSKGIIELANPGAPRFDFDPASRHSLGLLIEESRTNLLHHSSDLELWAKEGPLSVAKNQTLAPDATSSAEQFSSGSTPAFLNFTIPEKLDSGFYTLSIFVKSNSNKSFGLAFVGSTDNFQAEFKSANMANQNAQADQFLEVDDFSDWKRVLFTFKLSSQQNGKVRFAIHHNAQDPVFLWGAQLEKGAFATSYIPTQNSPVQRSADLVSADSKFFLDQKGSFSMSYRPLSSRAYGSFVDFARPAQGMSLRGSIEQNSKNIIFENFVGGSKTEQISLGTSFGYSDLRMALGISTSISSSALFGSLRTSQQPLPLGSNFDKVYLGQSSDGKVTSGHIRRFVYWERALSEGTLVYESGMGLSLPAQGQINIVNLDPVDQVYKKIKVLNFEIQKQQGSSGSYSFSAPDYDFNLEINKASNSSNGEYDGKIDVIVDGRSYTSELTCVTENENLR